MNDKQLHTESNQVPIMDISHNLRSGKPLEVLLAGRSKESLETLNNILIKYNGFSISMRHINNGHTDPLHGVMDMPDVLVLRLSEYWNEELNDLGRLPPSIRPSIIIVGAADEMKLMRMAMQAGARDFISEPIKELELLTALGHVAKDKAADTKQGDGKLTAIMNARGGSGASLIASNIAHMMVVNGDYKTALVDLDMQFGTLPMYLDLYPKLSLLDALDVADELDSVALEGYMMKHDSGLNVLGSKSDRLVMPTEISHEKLERIMAMLASDYDQIIVDLPRQIDYLTTEVLDRADNIIVVVQQCLTTLRDAKRLVAILRNDLAVPENKIKIVVNRYSKKSPVTIADIETALGRKIMALIPNDFKNITESINTGIPLYQSSKKTPVARSILKIQTELSDNKENNSKGLLARAFSGLMGG